MGVELTSFFFSYNLRFHFPSLKQLRGSREKNKTASDKFYLH